LAQKYIDVEYAKMLTLYLLVPDNNTESTDNDCLSRFRSDWRRMLSADILGSEWITTHQAVPLIL